MSYFLFVGFLGRLMVGKQYRPRSFTAERDVCSGSPLFAYRMYTIKHPFKQKWVGPIDKSGTLHLG